MEHAATRLGKPKKVTWDRTVFVRVLLSWQFWLLPTIFMRKFQYHLQVTCNQTADEEIYSLFPRNSNGAK
jgi:hypothetical protein